MTALPLRRVCAAKLTQVVVEQLEDLILSGTLPIGARLPPERALAARLGVSRPVVHEGLVALATRGLVAMRPRIGTVVSDYRREGSLALLASLVRHAQGEFAPPLLDGMLDLRRLVQTDAARRAAGHRTAAELAELEAVLASEAVVAHGDGEVVVTLDLAFHHTVALASGNPIYPMLVKSFEPAERNLASRFFASPALVPEVHASHRRIGAAIAERNAKAAEAEMGRLLDRGRATLLRVLAETDGARGAHGAEKGAGA